MILRWRALAAFAAICLPFWVGNTLIGSPNPGIPPTWDVAIGIATVGDEQSYDIVVDVNNNFVYVCGSFNDASAFGLPVAQMNAKAANGNWDGFLAQFDLTGNLQWAVNIGSDDHDECTGVAVDDFGNIYVSGYFVDSALVFDAGGSSTKLIGKSVGEEAFVASYDVKGAFRWARSGGGTGNDRGLDVSVSKSEVYLTGAYEDAAAFGTFSTESTYNSTFNGFIVKYDSLGNEQWLVEMKSDDHDYDTGETIADLSYATVADAERIYVVGYMGGTNMKFVDSSGTATATNLVNDDGNEDIFICAFDADGGLEWANEINNNAGTIRGFGIAIDCDGLYISGTVHDGGTFPSTYAINIGGHDHTFVAQFDPATGIDSWVKVFASGKDHEEIVNDVVADGFGNIFIVGRFESSPFMNPDTSFTGASNPEGFVAMYKNTGAFEWAHRIDGTGDVRVNAAAVLENNDLFVTGTFGMQANLGSKSVNTAFSAPNLFLAGLDVSSGGTKLTGCCPNPPETGTLGVALDTICAGAQSKVIINKYDGTIQWQESTDGGSTWTDISGATNNTQVVTPPITTLYRVIASATGCTNDTSVTIEVYVYPLPTTANAGNDQIICQDTFATFAGNNPTNGIGLWTKLSGPSTIQTPTAYNSDVYGLKVRSNYFEWKIESGTCPASRDTVRIFVIPEFPIDLGSDTAICNNDTINLNAGFPFLNHTWSTGATTQAIDVLSPGVYWVDADTLGCASRDSIVISSALIPVQNLGADTAFCDNDSVLLDAGNPGSTYLWSTGQTTQTIYATIATQIRVEVTSIDGCIIKDTVATTVIPLPTVDLGNDTTICAGQTVTFDAGNPTHNFNWSNGGGTQTMTLDSTDDYWVDVDTAGCTTRDSVVLTVVAAPTVNLGNDTAFCSGGSITLDAANAGANYNWSTGASSQTISVAASGTYDVEVDIGGICGTSDTIIVTVIPLPTVDLGNDTTICAGQTVTFDAGNPTHNFNWSNGGGTQTMTLDSTDDYWVDVDTAGCTTRDSVVLTVVAAPTVNLGNDTAFCSGGSITLDAANAGANYNWSTGASSQTISVAASGIYDVEVDIGGICGDKDTIVVTVIPIPTVQLYADTSLCSNDSITLDAGNPGHVYTWSTGHTTQKLTVDTAGIYWVDVDTAGCIGRDSFQLTITTMPLVNLGKDTLFCSGDSIMLDAGNSGATYNWSNGSNSQNVTIKTSQQLDVAVSNGGSCVDKDTILITVIPIPSVDLGNDTTLCGVDSFLLDAANASFNHNWSTTANTQSIYAKSSGSYWVQVDSAGCFDRDTIALTFGVIPTTDLVNDTGLCIGDSIALDAGSPGATHVWSTTDTSQIILAKTGGTYIVMNIDSSGCSLTDSVTLTFDPIPVVNLGKDTSFCDGGSVILDATSPGGSYNWSNGSTAATLNVTMTGIYHVAVTLGSNCMARDTVTVGVNPLPNVSAGGLDTAYCESAGAVALNLTPANGTLTGPGVAGVVFDPAIAGAGGPYTLNFSHTDTNGCYADTTLTTFVRPAPPAANAGPDQTVYHDNPIPMSANNASGFSTTWITLAGHGKFDDWNSGTTNLSFLGEGNNTFIWQIDGGICGLSTDTVTFEFLALLIPQGVSPNADGANDVLHITGLAQYPDAGITIFTRWGQEVYSAKPYKNDWDGRGSNGEQLADDTYFIVVNLEPGNDVEGFVVLKR